MDTRSIILKRLKLNIVLLLTGFVSFNCSSNSDESVVIENSNWRYDINSDGENLQFTDKVSGTDYLDHDAVSYCAYITKDGKQHNVTSVSLKGKNLHLEFGNTYVTAHILIRKAKDGITFKVGAVKGALESFTFLNVPLILDGMPYEPFAVCALSMNLFTHVRQLPALQTHLWATCYHSIFR